MSSFNPSKLLEMLGKAGDWNLCPNRIWQVCSQIKDWPPKQSTLQEILDGIIDLCEFSSRNFTAVQQYHELRTCKERDQSNEDEQGKACLPLRNSFNDAKLIKAVQSNKLTAWSLDGCSILEYPRPFMAISHVWSDGTGVGTWPSKQVNKSIACEGSWWDTLCVPQDRDARSKALSIMHCNYEYARVTLVHDRLLRNTALELAKSRKVKIIFKDSIKDLDDDILEKAQEGSFAAKAIKNLRRDRFSDMEDLLATLGPRYTSWLKDRATIAGLLAGI
ncbi:hypothetical protein F5B21DRAFT_517679 [Xylaria acuta]|nr:hypothetical protein F5B21DRAFT_517679 [Xylaria acuta]